MISLAAHRTLPAMGTVASRARGRSALLERSAFAEALDESLAVVASGDGRLVLVSGEAGIGKSALVRRFCDVAPPRARACSGALAMRSGRRGR